MGKNYLENSPFNFLELLRSSLQTQKSQPLVTPIDQLPVHFLHWSNFLIHVYSEGVRYFMGLSNILLQLFLTGLDLEVTFLIHFFLFYQSMEKDFSKINLMSFQKMYFEKNYGTQIAKLIFQSVILIIIIHSSTQNVFENGPIRSALIRKINL